jgi:hypothetical protein
MKIAIIAAVFAAMTLSLGAKQPVVTQDPQAVEISASSEEPDPDSLAATSTFYSVRPDLRRCASPICGGYFVKSVNMDRTRCADGSMKPECYVGEIIWNGQPEVEASRALLRGVIISKRHPSFGNLGALRVTESWQAANDDHPYGIFFRARDRGVRCVAAPCPTHHEAKLNSTFSRNVAGVDFSSARASNELVSKATMAMTSPDGVIVAGDHTPVKGPGGESLTLRAVQFYLRVVGKSSGESKGGKPCFRSGCSSQVCTDHNVITTCEWREEYACYQKAACERQKNGECGFTQTPELKACLARK